MNEVTALTYSDDDLTAIADYKLTIDNAKLRTPCIEDMIMTYECGYSELPEALKESIYKEVAYRYTHRGDEGSESVCLAALSLAAPFKEVDTWLA